MYRLADTTDHLTAGAAVLQAQLDLLTAPDELYAQFTEHGRRLINQAVFDQILIDAIPDPTDPAWQQINATDQTWHPDVQDLITLADAQHNAPSGYKSGPNAGRPADDGGPSAGSPTCIEQARGFNKPAMVELRGFEPLTPSMPYRSAQVRRRSAGFAERRWVRMTRPRGVRPAVYDSPGACHAVQRCSPIPRRCWVSRARSAAALAPAAGGARPQTSNRAPASGLRCLRRRASTRGRRCAASGGRALPRLRPPRPGAAGGS